MEGNLARPSVQSFLFIRAYWRSDYFFRWNNERFKKLHVGEPSYFPSSWNKFRPWWGEALWPQISVLLLKAFASLSHYDIVGFSTFFTNCVPLYFWMNLGDISRGVQGGRGVKQRPALKKVIFQGTSTAAVSVLPRKPWRSCPGWKRPALTPRVWGDAGRQWGRLVWWWGGCIASRKESCWRGLKTSTPSSKSTTACSKKSEDYVLLLSCERMPVIRESLRICGIYALASTNSFVFHELMPWNCVLTQFNDLKLQKTGLNRVRSLLFSHCGLE